MTYYGSICKDHIADKEVIKQYCNFAIKIFKNGVDLPYDQAYP